MVCSTLLSFHTYNRLYKPGMGVLWKRTNHPQHTSIKMGAVLGQLRCLSNPQPSGGGGVVRPILARRINLLHLSYLCRLMGMGHYKYKEVCYYSALLEWNTSARKVASGCCTAIKATTVLMAAEWAN